MEYVSAPRNFNFFKKSYEDKFEIKPAYSEEGTKSIKSLKTEGSRNEKSVSNKYVSSDKISRIYDNDKMDIESDVKHSTGGIGVSSSSTKDENKGRPSKKDIENLSDGYLSKFRLSSKEQLKADITATIEKVIIKILNSVK